MIQKRLLLRVHKWCGLTACLLIFVQAATGLVNAFRHDLAQLIDRGGMVRHAQGADAPLTEILRSLDHTHPQLTLERLALPEFPDGAYLAHLRTAAGSLVYSSVDPGSAEILRSGSIWRFPTEAAKGIHYDYTIGLPGLIIVSVVGLCMLLLATTGLAYWWPRNGRIARQLRINWTAPGKLVLRQLHRNTGAAMFLLTGFSLVTGLVLSLGYITTSIGKIPDAYVDVSARPHFNIDDVALQARTRYPNNDIRDIRFVGSDRVNVFFHTPAHGPRAVSLVGIDLQKGVVVSTLDAGANTALWTTWLPLHAGDRFRGIGKALITVNALVLIGLALSGPVMWFTRVRLDVRKTARKTFYKGEKR